ncbi:MAG TPA: hypothetical protein VJL33_00725, partial [Candidatus Bathyarchaeia archaeon]|nr:hypothetical protein [Candidatus Bathyarchaeia archaeon]
TGNTTVAGNITLTGLSQGSHNIMVYAADAYGSGANIGASDAFAFRIGTQTEPEIIPEFPPTSPLTVRILVGILTLIAINAALMAYFKTRKKMRWNHAFSSCLICFSCVSRADSG